jgi:hypothetical protein
MNVETKDAAPGNPARAGSRARRRRWGAAAMASTLALDGILYAARPAPACAFYNPLCWVEETLDIIKDLVVGVGMLVVDIVTLELIGRMKRLLGNVMPEVGPSPFSPFCFLPEAGESTRTKRRGATPPRASASPTSPPRARATCSSSPPSATSSSKAAGSAL